MEKENSFIIITALGMVVFSFIIYLFTRKKDSETQPLAINNSLVKREFYSRILLYIIGSYRLLELVYFLIIDVESERQAIFLLKLRSILVIPSIIIGILAVISAIVGIVLSVYYMKKEKILAKKLFIISVALLGLIFLWKYLIIFILTYYQ